MAQGPVQHARIGHALIRGLGELNNAGSENLVEAYKTARAFVTAAVINEKDTLATTSQLAADKKGDAKAKDMFGTVAVEVAIDKKGLPSSVKILKGDPVLAAAVVEAVKKWRWKPLELNGEAVEVTTTIIVTLEPR